MTSLRCLSSDGAVSLKQQEKGDFHKISYYNIPVFAGKGTV